MPDRHNNLSLSDSLSIVQLREISVFDSLTNSLKFTQTLAVI